MAKKNEIKYLLLIFIILLFILGGLEYSVKIKQNIFYKEKIEAAQKMERAILELRQEGNKRKINQKGINEVQKNPFYGLDFSEITTTLGSKESKQTSINPNFSAIVIDMLKELRIKKGEKVAVNFSSSFPAINIAVLCALDTLGIESEVISSIGASTYGGNNPDFSYLDMEFFLFERGIINKTSDRVSYGGRNDLGEDIDISVLEKIVARTKNYKKLIKTESFDLNLEKKIDFYNSKNIKAFINVGGNSTALGKSYISYEPGVIKNTRYKDKRSLIGYHLNKGIPVLHFLNIKKIANKYGLPIAPAKIDRIGYGPLYYEKKYSFLLLILGMIVGGLGIVGYRIIREKNKF